MAFTHAFDATTLREYDIRGIVGKTLHDADAFAIGRVFGTIIAREGGTRVAVGYDGRLTSPHLEQALVDGLKASGMHVLCIGVGPRPMRSTCMPLAFRPSTRACSKCGLVRRPS